MEWTRGEDEDGLAVLMQTHREAALAGVITGDHGAPEGKGKMLTRGLTRCAAAAVGAVVVALTCGRFALDVAAQDAAPIIASGGEIVLLRDASGWSAAAVSELADGSALQIAGDAVSAARWLALVPGQRQWRRRLRASRVCWRRGAEAVPVEAAPLETDDAWAPETVEMASRSGRGGCCAG